MLTEQEADALLESIRGMSARGIAVIFITHRLQEILNVCDKVAVMRDGVLVREVAAKETTVKEITRWMVGRTVDEEQLERRTPPETRTIMSIRSEVPSFFSAPISRSSSAMNLHPAPCVYLSKMRFTIAASLSFTVIVLFSG